MIPIIGAVGGMAAGGGAAAGGGMAAGGGLSGLLAGMGRFGAPGTPGAVGGTPMAGGAPGGAQPSFWQQFQQMYGGGGGAPGAAPASGGAPAPSNPFTAKMGQGAQLATAYLDNLENRVGRLSEMYRGPTMPFRPHLNTSQVGPNVNPGQIGLSQLLASIATRRG